MVVGLTGGIGSGKSTVAAEFEKLGVPVVDADAIAHGLTAPSGLGIEPIRALFGEQFIGSDGAMDRSRMRAHVFDNPGARTQLEAILHPMIRTATARQLAALHAPYCLLMIPLLVEAAVAQGVTGLRLDESLDLTSIVDGEVHVYGHDETIALVRQQTAARVRGHGSGMGVVWLSSNADVEASARALADDVVVFDQRGCLSPRIALLQGDEARAALFAEALHQELERGAALVPRGEVPAEARAEAARYLTTMTYAGRALVGSQHGLGIGPPEAALVLPPPYRHLHLVACPSLALGSALLAPFAKGVVTLGSDDPAAARALAPGGARVAVLGAMQRPPLDGPVDLREP